jgi:isopentenyl-diphosphate delta-isomerase
MMDCRVKPGNDEGGPLMSRSDNSADEVILVDEHDRPLGTMAKLEAHRRGLRHRAISVIVRDRDNRLLLQQRAAAKYHSGGLWTNTCCSHPRPGEATIEAARRRLGEEMGFTCELTFLFSTHYRADVSRGLIEDEIVHVFGGRFDGTPDPDPLEVGEWCWKEPAEVARDLDQNPEKYTVWFREYRHRFWPAMVG